jgi:hypothetical protein
MRSRRLPDPLRVTALAGAAAAAVALGAGCGSDAGEGAAAVPPDCLESWNAESPSQTFGRHVYGSEHGARQARVAFYEPGRGSVNVKGEETCGVVFAVPESDIEYGDVGLVVTRFGWASLRELDRTDRARLEAIQREATEAPNATLLPDGRLEPN